MTSGDNLLQELIGQHYWKMYLRLYGNLGAKKEEKDDDIRIYSDDQVSGDSAYSGI